MSTDLLNLTEAQRAEVEHNLCKNSLLYFATKYLSGGVEHGNQFIVGEHHMEWDALVASQERICILAPRDHGKSYFFNLAYPIWRGMFEPRGTQVYLFSANQDLANEFLQKIVEELTSNPRLAHLVPRNWETVWAKRRIRLTTGVELRARGFGVKVRGGHPKYIVCDDMLGDENIYSETVREKAKDYFLSAITNMVIPGGQLIVVGTPMHQADIYAHLRKVSRYASWKRSAVDRSTGLPLWPARYNTPELEAKKEEIGSVRFTREFLVEPFSDEMSMFPSYLFEGPPVQQYNYRLGMPGSKWDELGVTRRFMGVDIAISTTTAADYFVVFTIGKDSHENIWICDIQRHRGLAFQKQLDVINAAARKMDPGLIFIESNQMQRVWANELIRTTSLPIKPFITTGTGKGRKNATTQSSNKHTLQTGVPSLAPTLENRKWRIPRGDEYSVEQTDIWIGEMQAMSFIEGKVQSVGEHDDTVMACWIAFQAMRRGGFSVSFGGDDVGDVRPTLPNTNGTNGRPAQAPADGNGSTDEENTASGDLGMGTRHGTERDPMAAALWSAIPQIR